MFGILASIVLAAGLAADVPPAPHVPQHWADDAIHSNTWTRLLQRDSTVLLVKSAPPEPGSSNKYVRERYESSPIDGLNFLSMVSYAEIDCIERRERIVDFKLFRGNNLMGPSELHKPTPNWRLAGPTKLTPVNPDVEAIVNFACR